MIDLNLYRSRIGIFCTKKQKTRRIKTGSSMPLFGLSSNIFDLGVIFYLIFMIYFVLGMVSVLFEINSILPKDELIKTSYFVYSPPSDLSCMNALLKQWYSILILFLINKIFLNQGHALNFKNYLKFTWACTSKISLLGNSGKRFNRLISGLFCWLCLINRAL